MTYAFESLFDSENKSLVFDDIDQCDAVKLRSLSSLTNILNIPTFWLSPYDDPWQADESENLVQHWIMQFTNLTILRLRFWKLSLTFNNFTFLTSVGTRGTVPLLELYSIGSLFKLEYLVRLEAEFVRHRKDLSENQYLITRWMGHERLLYVDSATRAHWIFLLKQAALRVAIDFSITPCHCPEYMAMWRCL